MTGDRAASDASSEDWEKHPSRYCGHYPTLMLRRCCVDCNTELRERTKEPLRRPCTKTPPAWCTNPEHWERTNEAVPSDWHLCRDGKRHHTTCGLFYGESCSCSSPSEDLPRTDSPVVTAAHRRLAELACRAADAWEECADSARTEGLISELRTLAVLGTDPLSPETIAEMLGEDEPQRTEPPLPSDVETDINAGVGETLRSLGNGIPDGVGDALHECARRFYERGRRDGQRGESPKAEQQRIANQRAELARKNAEISGLHDRMTDMWLELRLLRGLAADLIRIRAAEAATVNGPLEVWRTVYLPTAECT